MSGGDEVRVCRQLTQHGAPSLRAGRTVLRLAKPDEAAACTGTILAPYQAECIHEDPYRRLRSRDASMSFHGAGAMRYITVPSHGKRARTLVYAGFASN